MPDFDWIYTLRGYLGGAEPMRISFFPTLTELLLGDFIGVSLSSVCVRGYCKIIALKRRKIVG